MPLKILLVDDHQVVRLGLRALLQSEPDVEVVGEAATGADALRLAFQLTPDVVLMDIRLPDRSGIEVCRALRQQRPDVQVLMLTSYGDEKLVTEAVLAGAAGYILKQLGTDELLQAIRAVGRGDAVLDPVITRQVLEQVRRGKWVESERAFQGLSDRELQILALVAEGKSNAEIGDRLMLSPVTVRNHVSAILGKLGLSNRIEAATYAVRNHIERFVDADATDV